MTGLEDRGRIRSSDGLVVDLEDRYAPLLKDLPIRSSVAGARDRSDRLETALRAGTLVEAEFLAIVRERDRDCTDRMLVGSPGCMALTNSGLILTIESFDLRPLPNSFSLTMVRPCSGGLLP
jgi:hypothetical protein